MLAEKKTVENTDQVEAALAWHDGDARATIETLLADCGHLREQLEIARSFLSKGITRGWSPEIDRKAPAA
ncbi:hypothetical protein [Rhizobium sp. BG4]|uniref:hypothetical protein n=1 Tax=Rhizobium sp. BG4 TaxID=2613770 RepID=UPI00193DF6AA|nr:hypothetical protein [Rhizobium sp. BG4]QRM44660.1 hypothetical protein F2982_15170 [Rhizobium sp. BG4]